MIPSGETDLSKLLKSLTPKHNPGDYVFCTVNDLAAVKMEEIIMSFKEEDGYTIIVKKEIADTLGFQYSFVTAWITLTVHSSLTAVGLTATFSKVLSDHGISCNVVAGFYHDHIFVEKHQADKALTVLIQLAEKY